MNSKKRSSELLPLPVKDILFTCGKVRKTRPRRLSDICPEHCERYPAKSRSATTPTSVRLSKAFFPPLNKQATADSSKIPKPSSSSTMELCVPSLGLLNTHFVTSPPSSIYDQDRSDLGTFCVNSVFSNMSADSVVSDDLDDNMEDRCLETLLTPEVISTLQHAQPPHPSQDFLQRGKRGDACLSIASDSASPKPAVSDMFHLDQIDKSYSTSDFLYSGVTSNSSFSMGSVCSPVNGYVPVFTDVTKQLKTLHSIKGKITDQNCSSRNMGDSNIHTLTPVRSSFLQRVSAPQIGIAAVIKSEVEELVSLPEKTSNLMRNVQAPNLHTHFNAKSLQPEIKCEVFTHFHDGKCLDIGSTRTLPKTVPSSGTHKRTSAGLVKTEPLSSELPCQVEEKSWEERWKDVETYLHSPDEHCLRKRRRLNSGSSGHVSDEDDDDSSSTFDDKEEESDYSDLDPDLADIRPSECESLVVVGKKQKQYFWQYNVQSKGPKGTRLKLAVDSSSDPHVLNDFEDPVFDECNTTIAGIRHGGKARKGDGNEISPNPKKLFMIGHQLVRLNRQINACQLGSDVPVAKRIESRKEKNKLASRACRLKKKAQHEANKIKLYGLEQEHSQLNAVLKFIWPHIREKAKFVLGQVDKSSLTSSSLTSLLDAHISQNLKSMIAGHTVEYVNSVILKVESGDYSGGLNIRRSHKT